MGVTYDDLSSLIVCCIGRNNAYKLQGWDGRYFHQDKPITFDLLYQHLVGQVTIATYVINEYNDCTFAVFDHDSEDSSLGLSVLLGIQSRLDRDGITSYIERSRRGGHLWVFCVAMAPALLRAWLLPYCPDDPRLEFYPKQESLTSQCPYGSAIRVPLGFHRLTSERYRFVFSAGGSFSDLFTSYDEAFSFFAHINVHRMVPPPFLTSQLVPTRPPEIKYPSKKTSSNLPSSVYGQKQNIAEWCLSHDPLAMIGRYVQLDRNGCGCCPFGAHHSDGVDSHPSFFVYPPAVPNIRCWYCHAWKQGGSLFDFFKLYYGMSAHDLWVALRQGAQF